MRTWDPQYQALPGTHYKGQEPQKGGLLYAKYGKGIYIYNAYAFYGSSPKACPAPTAFRKYAEPG
jgi:hypothetical protein